VDRALRGSVAAQRLLAAPAKRKARLVGAQRPSPGRACSHLNFGAVASESSSSRRRAISRRTAGSVTLGGKPCSIAVFSAHSCARLRSSSSKPNGMVSKGRRHATQGSYPGAGGRRGGRFSSTPRPASCGKHAQYVVKHPHFSGFSLENVRRTRSLALNGGARSRLRPWRATPLRSPPCALLLSDWLQLDASNFGGAIRLSSRSRGTPSNAGSSGSSARARARSAAHGSAG
jgi:hypothetical protein